MNRARSPHLGNQSSSRSTDRPHSVVRSVKRTALALQRAVPAHANYRSSRLQSGMPGNPGQDPAAQFGIIVKRELGGGPSFAGEQFVGSPLAFPAPADAHQGSQHGGL